MNVEKAKRLGLKAALAACFAMSLWFLWGWIVEKDVPHPFPFAVGFGVPLAVVLVLAIVEALKPTPR